MTIQNLKILKVANINYYSKHSEEYLNFAFCILHFAFSEHSERL